MAEYPIQMSFPKERFQHREAEEVHWRAATALFTTRYTVLDWASVPSYTVDSPMLDY